ncbi:MCE family protein [Nocardioides sp. SLBN-35]|uniref:MCE family protein n=1 Tax=Nocardioides sp. SLBN-35 TaxID=2768445 RepID=UPI0011696D88|nr:MCE family protein [Nocardioides sp. SLBN-35]TQK68786.1 phospholipid/cholesterol/gamma-HCH transport system substrate-binding protein [Nocardioides sp. SLBN-35]
MKPTLRTQLVALLVLAVAGSTWIGARYADVGRLLGRGGYTVTVHLADSGGIFAGADATYRGVSVGRVRTMTLTAGGVDAQVEIERSARIPADTIAVVANKSAVGEQYLDFQPRSDGGPFLRDGSQIARSATKIPVRTDALLTNLDALVASVSTDDLRTVVDELGVAFTGTGPQLRRLIESSSEVIATAQDKYEVTAQLIRDSRVALQAQVDHGDNIRTFVHELSLLSGAIRAADPDLRRVIDDGASAARTLEAVIAENATSLGRLVDRMITTNRVVRAHLPGIQGVLVLAPYGLEGAYSILAKDPATGKYAARFSLSMQPEPDVCTNGTPVRPPFDTSPGSPERTGEAGRCTAPRIVATYDETTKRLLPGVGVPEKAATDEGGESWRSLVVGAAVQE